MKAFRLGEAIGRLGLLRVVCLWLAHVAGRLVRRPGLGMLAGFVVIVAVAWMVAKGVVPQVFARAEPPFSYEERVALWKVAVKEAWAEGYSAPRLVSLEGENKYSYYGRFWVLFRGTTETGHVDTDGKPITARCMHLYAKEAEEDDAVGLLAPHPYFLGFLTWPEATIHCTMYDNENKVIPRLNLPPRRTG